MDIKREKFQHKKEILSFVIIIIIIILIRTLVFGISLVPTGSMQQTILPGDYIFSTKYNYGYSNASFPFEPNIIDSRIFASKPNRGEIIIFKLKDNECTFVKRLIGLPGDKIEIRGNTTYINDIAVERTFIDSITDENGTKYNEYLEILPNGLNFHSYNLIEANINRNSFGPVYVPDGHYFFLGDNRDNSADSRSLLGFVPFEALIAKAQLILVSNKIPLKGKNDSIISAISNIPKWLLSFRGERMFKSLYNST